MLHATNDRAPARPQYKKRDADAFAAYIRARQVAPTVGQHELHNATHVDDDQIVLDAQKAAERLITGAAWNDWVTLGRAARVGRTEAMREAHVNRPEGRGYAVALHCWLARTGLDKVLGDNSTRSRLLDLIDHITDVEVWRQTLQGDKRLELNHPRVVWQHWQRSKVVPDPNKVQKPSPVAQLKQSLIESQEEIAELKEANGGNLFTSRTTAKDVVRILRETFSTTKFNDIRLLMKAAMVKSHDYSYAGAGLVGGRARRRQCGRRLNWTCVMTKRELKRFRRQVGIATSCLKTLNKVLPTLAGRVRRARSVGDGWSGPRTDRDNEQSRGGIQNAMRERGKTVDEARKLI